jgi:DNA-binding MarR family transcriptional regulator
MERQEKHSRETRADGGAGTPSAPKSGARARSGPDEILDLESFLPYRLNLLNETVSRSLSRVYAERHGIGVPEWRVLVTLGQYREMTAKEIGAHSQMHKTKVSRATAALEKKGFLARVPAKRDRRAALLSLTALGTRVYRDLVPAALEFSSALEAGLSDGDRAALDRLLRRLKERAEEISATMANGGNGPVLD